MRRSYEPQWRLQAGTAKPSRYPMLCCIAFLMASCAYSAAARDKGEAQAAHNFYIDCRCSELANVSENGSIEHPWSSLAAAQAHVYAPGDRISLARGGVCRGSFAPKGSGERDRVIRLTAYGTGPRPRIVATSKERQAFSLFNQQYWQIDSLDIAGGNTYGIFISGDKGTLHHLHLKNLLVHDVMGGEPKSKDNGLVVVGPSSADVAFEDVLVDGVSAAHTNQWAGILIGGGNYAWKPDAKLNDRINVRNSTVQDVFGDGIVLFRDSNGVVETSAAWQTGMQPTESIGTPNAIWTWTCIDCVVRDNEAFLTDSPGIDGGAYDIDWDNTRNIVERNYAHDTQGYCFAAFAAGYVTRESVIRDNLCIDNGLSPRLAALQGAAYLHTWNGGTLRGLRIEYNTFLWNPPVSTAAAIVDDAATGNEPVIFTGNRIDSSAPLFYRGNAQFEPSANVYHNRGAGDALFILGNRKPKTLAALQDSGLDTGSILTMDESRSSMAAALRIDATIELKLDSDGLLVPECRAQWVVLKSLGAQYTNVLAVTIHWIRKDQPGAEDTTIENAMTDLENGSIVLAMDGEKNSRTQRGNDRSPFGPISRINLIDSAGTVLEHWQGFQNAATLGGAVRARLGTPRFAEMDQTSSTQKILTGEKK